MMKALGMLLVLVPAAIVLLAILGVVTSLALGIAGFLLFKVLPILVIGYVVLHLFFPDRAREVREELRGMGGRA